MAGKTTLGLTAIIGTALGSVMARDAVAQTWRSDWIEYEGHAYRLTEPMDWYAAEDLAVSVGGHLVTVDDAAEDQWIYDTFMPLTPPGDYA
jgi:hypothetical protein